MTVRAPVLFAEIGPVDARVFKGTRSANLLAQAAPHPAEAAQHHCRSNDIDTDTGTDKAADIYIGQIGDAQSSQTVSERIPIYDPDAIHSIFPLYSMMWFQRRSLETQMLRAGLQKTKQAGRIPHLRPIQRDADTFD